MNKKFQKLFFAGALLVGLAGMTVSCKDYEDDINALGDKVAALEETVNSLDKAVKAGAILESVVPNDNGIAVTVNKNGKTETYNIVNGAKGDKGETGDKGDKGDKGEQGPGAVVEANADGTWWVNGKSTNKPWKGEKGDKGDNGEDGKDALTVYYEPASMPEDAGEGWMPTWQKVTMDTATGEIISRDDTEEPIFPEGVVSAVFNPETQTLVLYNVKGSMKPMTISLAQELTSLVTKTDDFAGGIPAFKFEVTGRAALDEFEDKDTDDEIVYFDHENHISAQYYEDINLAFNANPTNAVLPEAAEAYKLDIRMGEYYARTNEGFALKNLSVKKENGVIAITAIPEDQKDDIWILGGAWWGNIDWGDILSMAAPMSPRYRMSDEFHYGKLYVENEDNTVSSDEFTFVAKNNWVDFRIACPKEATAKMEPYGKAMDTIYFYRTAREHNYGLANGNTISEKDTRATKSDYPVWTVDSRLSKSKKSCDIVLEYNETLDLNEMVKLYKEVIDDETPEYGEITEVPAEQMERRGINFKFEVVKNYKLTQNGIETDQADFINLEDGVVSTKVFEENGKAAIDRTPIVRVKAESEDGVLFAVAYIKIYFCDEVPAPAVPLDPIVIEEATKDVTYACGKGAILKPLLTVEQMNTLIYNKVPSSMINFHENFKFKHIETLVDGVKQDEKIGTLEEIKISEKPGTTTHSLKLTLNEKEIWENNGKTITTVGKYVRPVVDGEVCEVIVKFTTKINAVNTTFDVAEANMIKDAWNAEKTHGLFNVNVPNMGDTTSANCVYPGELNRLFLGHKKPAFENLTELMYEFDMNALKGTFNYGKELNQVKNVKYSVEAGRSGWKLSATADGYAKEVVAILNGETGKVEIIKAANANTLAKALVNTNEWTLPFVMVGKLCPNGSYQHEAKITFGGHDNFWVDIIRPVKITAVATDNFKENVDFGKDGSFIKYSELIAPKDWRGESFKDNKNYWSYYGPFKVSVDTDKAEADLDGEMKLIKTYFPEMKLKEEGPIFEVDGHELAKDQYGILSYKNGGIGLDKRDFFIKVPVVIEYGWGIITEEILIEVEKTVIDASKLAK